MPELLGELCGLLERGLPVVYCAVVETRGSTPQKAGAAMLVYPNGEQCGTLGGGCVEAEVKSRALRVLQGGDQAQVHTFRLDDDYGWDDGLICGGRMTVLVQAFQPDGFCLAEALSYFRNLRRLIEVGYGFTEAVIAGDLKGQNI